MLLGVMRNLKYVNNNTSICPHKPIKVAPDNMADP
jgi:hypothetical protein